MDTTRAVSCTKIMAYETGCSTMDTTRAVSCTKIMAYETTSETYDPL